jgi:hypothetical protein
MYVRFITERAELNTHPENTHLTYHIRYFAVSGIQRERNTAEMARVAFPKPNAPCNLHPPRRRGILTVGTSNPQKVSPEATLKALLSRLDKNPMDNS